MILSLTLSISQAQEGILQNLPAKSTARIRGKSVLQVTSSAQGFRSKNVIGALGRIVATDPKITEHQLDQTVRQGLGYRPFLALTNESHARATSFGHAKAVKACTIMSNTARKKAGLSPLHENLRCLFHHQHL